MHKKLTRNLFVFLVLLFVTFQGISVVAKDVNEVTLNGKQLNFSVEPTIVNGTTLVPMRAIFEALGSSVLWSDTDRSITATKGNSKIWLQIDNTYAKINNENKQLQVPPKIVNGSTLVPLRFISESFGAKIYWNSSLKKIIISSEGYGIYKVSRVVDGDTFELDDGQKVRLIGIDTPESVSPDKEKNTEFGVIASDYSKKVLTGQTVYLEKDISETDKYSRLLRYAYLNDGTMYNEQLVKEGYAKATTYPPDVKYADLFVKAEQFAQQNNKGLWSNGGFKKEPSKVTTPAAATTGKIKGNINSKGEKIYHVPGGAYYDRTQAEEYFDTEEEAIAAGYRKSSR